MRLPTLALSRRLAIVALASICTAHVPARADGERLKVSVIDYACRNPNDFKVFRSQLQSWVQTLPDEIPETTRPPYMKQLTFVGRTNGFNSAAEQEAYWKNGDALQIFSGSIMDQGQTYYVRSLIYLGPDQRYFPRGSIKIEVPFTVDSYADTHDTHSAVLFYGLATDAEHRDPRNKAVIAQFLKSAKDRLADIERRNSIRKERNRDLVDLEKAIAKAEQRLRSGK
jgi:hypothetical protein